MILLRIYCPRRIFTELTLESVGPIICATLLLEFVAFIMSAVLCTKARKLLEVIINSRQGQSRDF